MGISRRATAVAGVLIAVAAAAVVVGAQSPAPSPGSSDCLSALVNMSDCLTYVEAGSGQKKPEKGCCPELAGLVESHPICLCQLLSNPSAYGVQIDLSKALALPSLCAVQTPPPSTCAALGYAIASPSPAPIFNPTTASASAPAPAPGMDCMTAVVNMSDCLTYVEAGSELKKPEKKCCPELAGLIESQPLCLCQLLSQSNSFGVHIDSKRALQLPSICALQTPPVSTCSALGYPIGGLAPAPAPGPGAVLPSSGNSDNGASPQIIRVSQLSFLATAFLTALFIF